MAAMLAACFTPVFLFFHVAISLAPTIVSPFPSADSALLCVASTEAIHIVLSNACSNARPFYASFCIADVPCYPFSTKETGHWAYRIQNAARFAVNHFAMSLISASLRVTFSRLIFFFVAFRADEPPGRPRYNAM